MALEWRVFACAHCEEEGYESPYRYVEPVPEGANIDRGAELDSCPQCGSLHGFCPSGVGQIVVLQKTKGYGDIPVEPEGALL